MPYKFACDHCGKRFELETIEAKECPSCFWTTSVKRDDLPASAEKETPRFSKNASARPGRKMALGNLKHLLLALFLCIVFAAAGFLTYKVYKTFTSSSSRNGKTFSIKPQKEISPAGKKTIDSLAGLSPQEKEILSREVKLPADRTPDPGEQGILNRSVPFQTGWTEKLPSAVWTLDQYRKMIADQEAFYKMPFARSYKKKLEGLFKAKYLAAADAFTKGDVLAARNLWMESLAFPLYSKDLKKHRAVALTMLRHFINDTLSKVSAMNQSVLDKGKKSKEQTLSAEYQKLHEQIAQKKWQEALEVIARLISEVGQMRKPAGPQEAPPYPASFGTLDADLQRPLLDLMSPSPSSTADLQPLQQDLVEKKEVIETFTETYLKRAAEIYQSALGMIRDQKWQEAVQALGSLQGPPALQQDASEKIAILGKMVKDSA